MASNPRLVKAGILRELDRIVATVDAGKKREFGRIRPVIERIFNPNTPTYEISHGGVIRAFYSHRLSGDVPKGERDAYDALLGRVEAFLFGLGYRAENITTYQEHMILGSGQPGEYAKNPHTPIAILEGRLSVEEAAKARMLAVMNTALPTYYSGLGRRAAGAPLTRVWLEPLDADGSTLRDPRVIDMARFPAAYEKFRTGGMPFAEMLDSCTLPAKRSVKFPFRRD